MLEVDAFASVQDLIHAAIASKAGAATLKDVSRGLGRRCRRTAAGPRAGSDAGWARAARDVQGMKGA